MTQKVDLRGYSWQTYQNSARGVLEDCEALCDRGPIEHETWIAEYGRAAALCDLLEGYKDAEELTPAEWVTVAKAVQVLEAGLSDHPYGMPAPMAILAELVEIAQEVQKRRR